MFFLCFLKISLIFYLPWNFTFPYYILCNVFKIHLFKGLIERCFHFFRRMNKVNFKFFFFLVYERSICFSHLISFAKIMHNPGSKIKSGSIYSSTSKMIGEIRGWAFRQMTNSSVILTVVNVLCAWSEKKTSKTELMIKLCSV
jgi:hypothetical protein